MAHFPCTYDKAQHLPANTFVKTGHSFAGWATAAGNTVKYANKTSVKNLTTKHSTVIALYAKWTTKKCIVTYDSQGGNSVPPKTANYGDILTEPAAPARTGYIFDGWYTKKNGKGAKWDFAAHTVPASITLYAKWTPIPYSIMFNGNGHDSGSMAKVFCTYDKTQYLPANTFVKTGYLFAGWATAAANTVQYADKASVKNLSTNQNTVITLYAKWTVKQFTVSYDSQGGNAVPSETAHYGDILTEPAAPVKTGYIFDGWHTKKNGKGTKWDFANHTVLASIPLYAKWTPIPYTIVFNGNGHDSGSMANLPCTYDKAQYLPAQGLRMKNKKPKRKYEKARRIL